MHGEETGGSGTMDALPLGPMSFVIFVILADEHAWRHQHSGTASLHTLHHAHYLEIEQASFFFSKVPQKGFWMVEKVSRDANVLKIGVLRLANRGRIKVVNGRTRTGHQDGGVGGDNKLATLSCEVCDKS